MKTFYTIFIGLLIFQSCSFTKNKTITDNKTNRKELIGTCTRSGFQKEIFNSWFQNRYEDYQPNIEVINELKNTDLYKNLSIKIIFGTWCGDSRRELPHFYKIIDKANIPENIISLTAIDTNRSSHDKSLEGINFTRIPTFIFYRNGKEIGRIVESTKESLEKDMAEILKNK